MYSTKQFQVTFSMLEIYSEKVRDLLVPMSDNPPGGLKGKRGKNWGIFIILIYLLIYLISQRTN